MYIFKNAFISITRNKGRNILIAVIILVISCASAITLAIKNSADSLIESYENQYEITGTIQMDRGSFMKNFEPKSQNKTEMTQNFQNIEPLTVADIEKYGNSDYIKSYYYTNNIELNSTNIEKASMSTSTGVQMDFKKDINMTGSDTKMPDFTLTGYSKLEAMEEFISGKYKITSGEISKDFNSNNCIINSELAKVNNLSVGDTITFCDPNDESKTYDFLITGIFEETQDGSSDNTMNLFSGSSNTIITNSNAINNIVNSNNSLKATVNPTFVLKNSDVIDDFESELDSKGLNEYLSLTTNIDEVNSATKSVSNVSTFASTFLLITLAIGAVILIVINMINIRERKYEIGVLRTIGMKKSSLTCQFMIELLIITMVGLLIGATIGSAISVPTANMLLESEIEQSNIQAEQVNQNFGGGMRVEGIGGGMKFNGVTNVEQIKDINAVVDFKVILELIAISIILTILSSVVSMISIQRFSPLNILKERS